MLDEEIAHRDVRRLILLIGIGLEVESSVKAVREFVRDWLEDREDSLDSEAG